MSPCRSVVAAFLLLACVGGTARAARGEGVAPEVGIYAGGGPHRLLVISPRALQGRMVPLLTDLGTGAVRALFPGAEPGVWVAGETLRSPEPARYRLRFEGQEGALRHRLEIEDLATGARWSAARVPLREEEVELERAGTRLRGTLHLPAGPGPHPGIVLAPGSEEEGTRHSLDALPYVLAQQGFATLAVDKRGTGTSEGTWDVAHEVLAEDLAAWVEWLAGRAELDARIGVFGFSEGGWIGPLAATKTPRITFLIASGGGALPKSASFLHQAKRRLEEQGLEGEALAAAYAPKQAEMAASRRRAESGSAASPFDLRMSDDPAEAWGRFRGPVLFVIGADDVLVPPHASAARLREVLAGAGHPDYTLRVLPQATHGMFRSITGSPSEFFRMEGIAEAATGYWEILLHWLDSRVPRR